MSNLPGLGSRHRAPAAPDAPAPSGEEPSQEYVVDCAIYRDGERQPGAPEPAEAIREVRERGSGFVWIGMHAPPAPVITGIAETFGLHELAVEDVVHAHQRPKLERYADTLFMVLKTVRYVEHESPTTANEIVETGELMIFLGADFIVTVRHGGHCALSELRRELERQPERLAAGPAVVLHAVADHVVDRYLVVTEAVQQDIDLIESEVFAPRTGVDAEHIYLMKRETMELRRAVAPLRDPIRRLVGGESELVPDGVRSYFRDIDDHLVQVAERVSGFDELLSSLLDAALAKISLRQNTDMRKITAWAAILSIPTVVTGIYGMNFELMPELHWRFGYPAALLLILGSCAAVYVVLRRSKWF